MNFKKIHKIFSILSLFFFIQISGQQVQNSLVVNEHQIMVLARPQNDGRIMLRWAVTSAKAWRKLNKSGYQLTRYTITRNKQTLPQPIEKKIGVFKPDPLENWRTIVESNDNAAVMAQSLYGERFDIEGMDELSAIVNLAEEQEQRFTWGLYVADQDYKVAVKAGLGYIDTDVKKNEKYVYKLTPLVSKKELDIKEGGVFIGLEDYEELPKPLDLAATFLDKKTMLSWNYAIYKQTYNSYFIERSEDGKTFKKLNTLPLTSLNNSQKTDPKRMFYLDSISNKKTYYYRILGKTPFGELSPVSEVVSGKAEKLLKYVPRITKKKYLKNKSVILEWEFLEEGNKEIKGFELNRSNKAKGIYKKVIKNIPPETRQIQVDSLQATNYFTITAIGKNGGSRTSFASLVQPVDSIPPNKPIGLIGKIDSLGIVSLEWNKNKEEDMLGYRVLRGNNKDEEFSQITVSPHQGIKYYDSISVKSLNDKVYYQIIAVDQRYNASKPSEVLVIEKPDFIKPTQPVFKSFNIKENKVCFSWTNSSSKDVIKHEVYKKSKEKVDWELVYTVNTATNKKELDEWIDENVEEGHRYSYTIIAIDDSQLESDPAKPLSVAIPKTNVRPLVKGLSSYVDKKNGYIELYWKAYKEKNVAELAIYKGVEGKKITLFKNVVPTQRRMIDTQVKPNNIYKYLIRAVYKDGTMSKVTKLDVKY